MNYEIIPLPKDRWKGTAIPLVTRSDSYYDFELSPLNGEGCTVSIVRKTAEKEIVHTPEEYDFPDSLYQDHWEGAEAYGVVSDAGELMACIEVCPEEWSNRLMVTELWVSEVLIGFYLHQGFELIGFDTCCYTNDDIGRREVRINLGYFFHREGRRR